MLVDDSPELRALVRGRLEASGFEVVGEGGDGDEAIILAHRLQPALLLLDTSMPRVDGIEALPVILAVSPATMVVMFTGFEEPGLMRRARELGAADVIQKSIQLEDLPARLAETLPIAAAGGRRRRRGVSMGGDSIGPAPRTSVEEQAVLSEHVQQFRELFDRAEIGMATLTSSGSIVRANRALASMMSCSPSDLVGVEYGRLTVGRGDGLDLGLQEIYSLGADLASFEHFLPAPLGEEPSRTVRVTLVPIRDSNRHLLYVFAQVQDVTAQRAIESDLRRSEQNFRRLVTAVGEYAIFMLDVDGLVVSWNPGAQRIKGYAAHEIVGRHFGVFYPQEEQAKGHPQHNLEHSLAEGSYSEEGWRIRRDGSRFWASVVITPVYDDAGRHVGFAKVTRDQTQQRDHEDERRRFLDQRIHLLAVTAHELRTPTTVIDGSADALHATWDRLSEEERESLLGNIRSSADRLRRLAADLATASQLDAEMLPLHFEEVSLPDLLRSAKTRSRAAGIDIRIELDVPKDATLRADPQRLGQALDNLLDNAARHGIPPIRVVATTGKQITIRVTDGGPGVPEDLLPRLFDRFAAAGQFGRTGLGLHLVREIAREHGGDATYHPPVGTDPTAFQMTLPRRH